MYTVSQETMQDFVEYVEYKAGSVIDDNLQMIPTHIMFPCWNNAFFQLITETQ